MLFFDSFLLDTYLQSDPLRQLLSENEQPPDSEFASHRWLMESPAKRLIYLATYGDLLMPAVSRMRVLDVGGGYCALSRLLIRHHDYTLVDPMVHDRHDALRVVEKAIGVRFWANADWQASPRTGHYDVILANDLFPNVDQRLALFLQGYLPFCKEMRLTLTYYPQPRYYHVKRLDADEHLWVLAWDAEQVQRVLATVADRIVDPNWEALRHPPSSIFPNQRQVCLVRLRGDRHA
jgi:hypothetical protein